MTARVVDLARVRAALRALDEHVKEHVDLTSDVARERCAEWLAGEEPDEQDMEPASRGRRNRRPASRGD